MRTLPVSRPLLFALVAATAVAAALALAGSGALTGQDLRVLLMRAKDWHGQNPGAAAAAFWLMYVAVTALSLPFAVWMTLAAGALFGVAAGLALALTAATCGATLAFLAARLGLRDWVQRRFGPRLRVINAGIARDGAFYLFTLRLIPVIPFFAVNLLMGLTPISTRRFAAVSAAGMLPGTAVFVNAGTQLASIDSLTGIATPRVLLAFAALAALPWAARLGLGAVRRRRVYARWPRPRRLERNLIVIGAGSAGLVSAYIATATRARVTLIEGHKMGGDCLNTGCVPSKALIRSARLAHQMAHADRYGLTPVAAAVSFRAVMARVQAVIAAIAPHDSVERYRALGAEVLQGHARLIDPWTVEVTDAAGGVERRTARAIILATGAQPTVPPLPGLAEAGFLTSDTLWAALSGHDAPPARMLVLGGGPIGCELAQAFARLGSAVTVLEAGSQMLPREDPDAAALVAASLAADGVRVLTGHTALSCGGGAAGGRHVVAQAPDGSQQRIVCDEILVAVGRSPRLAGFGLEELGIPTDRVVQTNDYLETLYPNILAAGDVAGPHHLTHAAAHQAWHATFNALFGGVWRFRVDHRVIPYAIFTDPEVARVGLSESDARAQGIAVEVTRYGIEDLDRAIVDGAARGFVKILTAPGRDRILGVTIAGEGAAELIAEFVTAMKHGLGLKKILGTIHIYPTMTEANSHAAGQWRRARLSPRALSALARFHAWRRG